MKRFSKNNFTVEKNHTVVNFPLKDVDFSELIPSSSNQPRTPLIYDLTANVVHDGNAESGSYKLFLRHRGSENWFQIQDLLVGKTLPQTIFLSESYIQIWERRLSWAVKYQIYLFFSRQILWPFTGCFWLVNRQHGRRIGFWYFWCLFRQYQCGSSLTAVSLHDLLLNLLSRQTAITRPFTFHEYLEFSLRFKASKLKSFLNLFQGLFLLANLALPFPRFRRLFFYFSSKFDSKFWIFKRRDFTCWTWNCWHWQHWTSQNVGMLMGWNKNIKNVTHFDNKNPVIFRFISNL